VQLAKLSMEGGNIHWFNLLHNSCEGLTWTKLKRELIGRYGGGRSDNPYGELKDLNQTRSIEEYLLEFESFRPRYRVCQRNNIWDISSVVFNRRFEDVFALSILSTA